MVIVRLFNQFCYNLTLFGSVVKLFVFGVRVRNSWEITS